MAKEYILSIYKLSSLSDEIKDKIISICMEVLSFTEEDSKHLTNSDSYELIKSKNEDDIKIIQEKFTDLGIETKIQEVTKEEGLSLEGDGDLEEDSELDDSTNTQLEDKREVKGAYLSDDNSFQFKLQNKKKSKQFSPYLRDLVLVILFCTILLSISYVFSRSLRLGKQERLVDKYVNSMFKTVAEAEKEEVAPSLTIEENIYSFDIEDQERNIFGKFEVKDQLIRDLIVFITTPKPRILTEEEVIRNVKPKYWLKRIELEDLKIKVKSDKSFLAYGSAKIFIEIQKRSKRFLAKTAISGVYLPDSGKFKIKIIVNHGFDDLPQNQNFVFELKNNAEEDLKLFISEEIITSKTTRSIDLLNLDEKLSTGTNIIDFEKTENPEESL